jgi:hypothetical protein
MENKVVRRASVSSIVWLDVITISRAQGSNEGASTSDKAEKGCKVTLPRFHQSGVVTTTPDGRVMRVGVKRNQESRHSQDEGQGWQYQSAAPRFYARCHSI